MGRAADMGSAAVRAVAGAGRAASSAPQAAKARPAAKKVVKKRPSR